MILCEICERNGCHKCDRDDSMHMQTEHKHVCYGCLAGSVHR